MVERHSASPWALAALLLAPPLAGFHPQAQPGPVEGCTAEAAGVVVCVWEVVFDQPSVTQGWTRRPVPLAGNTVINANLRTESGVDVDWSIRDNVTGRRLSEVNAPRGDPRAENFSWVVLLIPTPEQEPVVHIEQFLQNDEEFEAVNALVPPLTHPARYVFTFRFRPAEGTLAPERPAGGPDDVHLEDGVGDAPGFHDLTGGWFDDPWLDDGVLTAGLVVPELRTFPESSAESHEYGLEWDLLGQHYAIVWGRDGAVQPPLRALEGSAALLFRGHGDSALRVMGLPAVVDPGNGTLSAQLPVEAIGNPGTGAEFTGITAFSQRVLARSRPFDPAGTDSPSVAVERVDEATAMRRAFALGGPAVWARLRGEPAPSAPLEVQAPPPAAPADPWAPVLPFLALAALGVVLAGAVLATARSRAAGAAAPAAQPPVAGAVFLDKYHVERELGRGASGSAWQATHLNLRRTVVIKQLHPEHTARSGAMEAFRAEARILAALDHPHVTRIYDVELVGRAWYIVMEYVDGGSLEDRLRAGPLAAEDAVRVTSAMLDGLAYIHGHGVLHLDLKPANVLLTSTGIVKIADFGVSRPKAGPGTDPSDGSPTGTPLYLSPEQVRGAAPNERSDLYAVAVTFHELVAGRYYVEADVADFIDVRRAIVEEPPGLPLPQLPPGLNAWLGRALAKRPEERFATATEMRAALHAAARGPPAPPGG